jgi:hypothetical protein
MKPYFVLVLNDTVLDFKFDTYSEAEIFAKRFKDGVDIHRVKSEYVATVKP